MLTFWQLWKCLSNCPYFEVSCFNWTITWIGDKTCTCLPGSLCEFIFWKWAKVAKEK